MYYTLSLEVLTLSVRLGVTQEERTQQQLISLWIDLQVNTLPYACKSDQLTDTICYADLAKKMQVFCSSRAFHLIEHITYELFLFLKNYLPPSIKVRLLSRKKPIMKPELGASAFCISEWPSHET